LNTTFEYYSRDAGNTATSKCRVRTCADNSTATIDAECTSHLKGCINKGLDVLIQHHHALHSRDTKQLVLNSKDL